MPASVKKVNEQVLRNIVLNALNNKLENKKKLDEQLINVICDSKTKSDVKLKKVKYLIRLGADVNARKDGISALSWAKKSKEEEIAKYLEDNGGKEWVAPFGKEWFSKIGEDFVDTVFSGSTKEVIKEILVKSVDELFDGDNFERVLDECEYANGHKVIVSEEEVLSLGKQFWDKKGNLKSAKEIEVLIQQGAYVDIENESGDTALTGASYCGHKEVVEMLLQNGADVNIKDNKGQTALMMAAGKGHKEIAEMLLEGGADVNEKSETGDTALIIASYCGHKEVVEMLLQNGADINIQNKSGMTALMWASKKGHLDVVHILLEGGANVRKRDYWHQTALQMASGPFKNAIIKEIEESFQKTTPTIGEFLDKIFGGLTR